MTNEEKQLLLNDLCTRLPYGVKCYEFCYDDDDVIVNTVETLECIYPSTMEYKYKDIDAKHNIERIKPYLRPMSSMTEEEKEELKDVCTMYRTIFHNDPCSTREYFGIGVFNISRYGTEFETNYEAIDLFNSHHLDYRGLIPMGLALEAPEGMYN